MISVGYAGARYPVGLGSSTVQLIFLTFPASLRGIFLSSNSNWTRLEDQWERAIAPGPRSQPCRPLQPQRAQSTPGLVRRSAHTKLFVDSERQTHRAAKKWPMSSRALNVVPFPFMLIACRHRCQGPVPRLNQTQELCNQNKTQGYFLLGSVASNGGPIHQGPACRGGFGGSRGG